MALPVGNVSEVRSIEVGRFGVVHTRRVLIYVNGSLKAKAPLSRQAPMAEE
jgi:hypothetical protein